MYASKLDVSLPTLHVSFCAIDNRVEGITALLDGQGFTLAVPCGRWHLIFAHGWQRILVFSYKSYAGHPGFNSIGLPSILLEHSLDEVNSTYNVFFYQELHFMPKILCRQ